MELDCTNHVGGLYFWFSMGLEFALLSVLSVELFSTVQRGAFALRTGTLQRIRAKQI